MPGSIFHLPQDTSHEPASRPSSDSCLLPSLQCRRPLGHVGLACQNIAHDLSQGVRKTGKTAFAAVMRLMDAHYREQLSDVVVMASEDGRRAAVEYVVHGEYLSTDDGLLEARGQRYVLLGGTFFEIAEEGQKPCIFRISNHYNLQGRIAQVS